NNIIHSQDIEEICSVGNLNLFKDDDDYYNLLSAFQKSIRGSDVQASIYYLAMLLLSNDLESLIRRLLVIAYEDIGLANPNLVTKTMMACDSAIKVGMPECRIIFSNIVIDLALSPKSKSAEMAIDKAMSLVSSNPLPIPDYLHLVNISLQNADKYDYDNFESWNQIQYLPNNIKDIEFYLPIDSSPYETILKQNYQKLRQIKRTTNLRSLKK
ncbi:MAG: replication-associated recombination protein A, partial [Erysipelotrichaceae bacterium]